MMKVERGRHCRKAVQAALSSIAPEPSFPEGQDTFRISLATVWRSTFWRTSITATTACVEAGSHLPGLNAIF